MPSWVYRAGDDLYGEQRKKPPASLNFRLSGETRAGPMSIILTIRALLKLYGSSGSGRSYLRPTRPSVSGFNMWIDA